MAKKKLSKLTKNQVELIIAMGLDLDKAALALTVLSDSVDRLDAELNKVYESSAGYDKQSQAIIDILTEKVENFAGAVSRFNT